MALMKNSINISNNVNLILNTYKCFFLKLLLRIFNVVRQLRPCNARQASKRKEMERFWNLQRNLQRLKFVNHNGAKMVDVWNVNKLTKARTKMEVGKLRTRVAQ